MSQASLVSLSQSVEITCPECDLSFPAEVWVIVDPVERPDLGERIVRGALHQVRCPNGHTGELDAPLLLHLPDRNPPLLFVPAQNMTGEQNQEQALRLLGLLKDRLGPAWQDAWLERGLAVAQHEVAAPWLTHSPEERLPSGDERAAAAAEDSAGLALNVPAPLRAEVARAKQSENRYLQTNDLPALDEAVAGWKRILGHPEFPVSDPGFRLAAWNNAGGPFLRRYWARGNLRDLDRALELWQQALDLTPQGSPDRPSSLNNLGLGLRGRYAHTGRLADLEEAIAAFQQAVDLTPQGFPDRPSRLSNLGTGLSDRYARTGRLADLEQAVAAFLQAVDLTPQGSPARPIYLNNLGNGLSDRHARTGVLADLEQAVGAFQQAVDLTPQRSAALPGRLNNLGTGLSARYARTGQLADLEQAIAAFQHAVEVTPQGSPDRAKYLNNLGTGLSARYARTGQLADLEQAVAAFQQALDLPPDRPMYFNNLGNGLRARYARTGQLADLERAVAAFQQAVDLTPQGSPARPMYLNNLGNGLSDRHARTGLLADLERAVAAFQQAVDLTPQGSPDLPIRLNGLGAGLIARYDRTGQLADLEQAIAAFQQALDLTPQDSPDRPGRLNNLGTGLKARYARTGQLADLEQAVAVFQYAVDLAPQGSPDRPNYLYNLGLGLRYGYARTGMLDDLKKAVNAWQEGRDHLHTVVLATPEPGQLANEANRFTHQLLQAHLDLDDPVAALEAMESGKALALRLELTRTGRVPEGLTSAEQEEFSRLVQEARDLASARRSLKASDLSESQRTSQLADLSRRDGELRLRLGQLESRDRNFGLPPLNYGELCQLAATYQLVLVYLHPTNRPDRGTVAFLVHPASSPQPVIGQDVIFLDRWTRNVLDVVLRRAPPGIPWRLTAVPELVAAARRGESLGWLSAYGLMHWAHHTEHEQAAEKLWKERLDRLLRGLSRRLIRLLASRLRELSPRRVVLLPGEWLALLPLHAVPLADGPAARTLGEEFEIAYAPLGTALELCLQRAEQRRPSNSATLVAVANPDGSLAFSDDEVETIARRFNGRAQVAHGLAARRNWLLPHTRHSDFVLLSTHAWFSPGQPHLSSFMLAHPDGHTTPDQKEDEVHFGGERLMLDDVWAGRLSLKQGCVVSADACETGQVDPTVAMEESQGFPAAFLGAGAASVIASLWAVDDLSTAWLTDKVFELMLSDGRRPSAALREATRWLRRLTPAEALAIVEPEYQRMDREEQQGVWEDLSPHETGWRYAKLARLRDLWYQLQEKPEPPFADPVHWAAFAVYGA